MTLPRREVKNGGSTRLDGLIGRVLSAVVFVQDYLQLQFDGSTLTLTTWPVVETEQGEFKYGEPRYRDVLCGCIAKNVDVADVIPGDRLVIGLSDRVQLAISLRSDDRVDPEAARLDQEDGHWWVW